MKFATIKPDGLAIVHNDTLIPITGVLAKGATMLDLIAQYDQVKAALADLAAKGGGTKLDPKAAQTAGRAAVENLGRRGKL